MSDNALGASPRPPGICRMGAAGQAGKKRRAGI